MPLFKKFKPKPIQPATPLVKHSKEYSDWVNHIDENKPDINKSYIDKKINDAFHDYFFNDETHPFIEAIDVSKYEQSSLDDFMDAAVDYHSHWLEKSFEDPSLYSFRKYKTLNSRYIVRVSGIHLAFNENGDGFTKLVNKRIAVMHLLDNISNKVVLLGFYTASLQGGSTQGSDEVNYYLDARTHAILADYFNEFKVTEFIKRYMTTTADKQLFEQYHRVTKLTKVPRSDMVHHFNSEQRNILGTSQTTPMFRYFSLANILR